MTVTPTIVIAPIHNLSSLKECTPNLMPFHINYSGPAPISTYMPVRLTSEAVGAPSPPEPEQTTEDVHPPRPSFAKRVTDATTRFISSFRGRTIQGLKVEVPAGYMGLMLKADEQSGGKMARSAVNGYGEGNARTSKEVGRSTRSMMRVIDVDAHGEEDHGENGMDVERPIDPATIRTLVPSSRFSSFILWHADHPVDEGRDEYFRSLTEWTQLAHEIHKTEE